MSELNVLFRQRIGIPVNEKLTFETLDRLLEKTATALPFENLCVLANRNQEITKENLMNKILVRKEGGLCYQLNPLLYFFLIENGFHAVLGRGEVYNHTTMDWTRFGRTHVIIFVQQEGQTYLVDTGFGAKLPLKPVPLTGEIISSMNGHFRVKAMESDYGDYILEVKLKNIDEDWKIGYAFDSKRRVENIAELNEVQKIIAEHENSSFNKTPLITQLQSDGNVATLTDTSFTQWKNGTWKKEPIDSVTFKKLAEVHFGLVEQSYE